MIAVDWVLRKVVGLDDEEMKLLELEPGDRVKVASYDSDPYGKGSVKVTHEVAIVKGVSKRYGVTVEFITGPNAGKKTIAMPNTITKLESVIDALGATGEAGETSTVAWEDLSDRGE